MSPRLHFRVSRAIAKQQIYLLVNQGPVSYCSAIDPTASSRKASSVPADERFQQHFTSLYGNERWTSLSTALQQPTQHVVFANPFTADDPGIVLPAADRSHMQLAAAVSALLAADKVCMAAGWSRIHSRLPFYRLNRQQTSVEAICGYQQPPNIALQAQKQHINPQCQLYNSYGAGHPSGATANSVSDDLLQLGHTAVHASTGCQLLYFMDLASALPALALNPQPGMRVLDMCAAPGGKSLLLASQLLGKIQLLPGSAPLCSSACSAPRSSSNLYTMQEPDPQQQLLHKAENRPKKQPEVAAAQLALPAAEAAAGAAGSVQSSHLTSNDRSQARRARLRNVLHGYIPQKYHHHITITGHDATRWHQFHPSTYDAILVDAPCSSERHLIQRNCSSSSSPAVITRQDWSLSRIKRNASVQLSLLMAAGQCVVPGGWLVYSTCSINPQENDQVVQKACKRLEKLGVRLQCLTAENWQRLQRVGFDIPGTEGADSGMQVYPDKTGWGPMYWCVLQRVQ